MEMFVDDAILKVFFNSTVTREEFRCFFYFSVISARMKLQKCRSAGESRGVSVADAQHELHIGREHSIVDWNQYCSDIAVSHFISNPVQIGGLGHIAEIEEEFIFWKKHNPGE